ncbi:MAG: 3'-5' exonuclease [Proteobacteria bacterium]|nr:3'-5' exonuclease [Pseudomonadota bacterium]
MRWPWQSRVERRRVRSALPGELRGRLERLRQRELGLASGRRVRSTPLALARFVALDLETTGPHMDRDRVIAIGAVAVAERALAHGDAFAAVLRQRASSSVDNILVHQIGGQQQLGGVEPAAALLDFLEYRGASLAVAFRSEFDATVLAREVELTLGIRTPRRFLDLAVLLPALFPGTPNDTLEDWIGYFGLVPIGRHDALADAYTGAQLLLIALDAAQRLGSRTTGDLVDLERAQRWLGRRR